MAAKPPLKAILFDIGGVVVQSPFQAILDYEKQHSIPIGYINFAIQKGPPDTGAWQRLERGDAPLDDTWFAAFKQQLERPAVWAEYWTTKHSTAAAAAAAGASTTPPPIPDINAKRLFWRMMRISRYPDPWMYPALKKLRTAAPHLLLGALSNTVDFPMGVCDDEGVLFDSSLAHGEPSSSTSSPSSSPSSSSAAAAAAAAEPTDVRALFDVFVSSAHVGVRKPDPRAYEVAVGELDRVARERGVEGGVRAEEVLFLDDIGGNLKGARGCGLWTLKVGLGRTREAVGELEGWVGADLGSGLGGGRKEGSRL